MPQAKFVRTLFRRPTLFPAGVGTVSKSDPKDRLGIPDPTQWAVFFEDFNGSRGDTLTTSSAVSNGWAALNAGQGGVGTPLGVQVPDAAIGTNGLYKLTTSAGIADSIGFQLHATLGQHFVFDITRKFYMETRLQLDSATLGDLGFGVVPASTSSLLTVQTDGFRIGKTNGVSTFQSDLFAASNTPKLTTTSMFGGAAMPLSKMITMGMAYNGVAYGPGSFGPNSTTALTAVNFEFVFYVDLNDGNGIRQQAVVAPATSFSANTVGLMPSVSYLNTTAVARNVTMDYIMVAQERFNV